MNTGINKFWQNTLQNFFNQDDFKKLIELVRADYSDTSKTVYPTENDIFRAFNETPLDKVKVVILGQDPYHNKGQAHGLCFSVPEGIPTPPSLKNIFKEIKSDIYLGVGPLNMSTDLTHWATQGVFLLNSVLTVLENQPGSHSKIGWEEFTDFVIKTISDKQDNVVFILEAPHPSPLSAHRGFLGCSHFSKANSYLRKYTTESVAW